MSSDELVGWVWLGSPSPLRPRPDRHLHRNEARLHPLLELIPVLVHDRAEGPVVAVGEAADGGAGHDAHAGGDFQCQVQVFGLAVAFFDSGHELVEPAGAFAAGGALAAGFVFEESRDVPGDGDHVGVFVEDGGAGGAEAHDVVLAADVEVHFGVELVGAEDAHGDAAGDGAFELLSAAHAAAVVVDEGRELDAEVALVDAGAVDVAADTHELGAPAGWAADGGLGALLAEPLPAVLDDARHMAEGFGVVDDGGLAEEALDGGEGRLDARPAALAFEGFEEAGLFTTYIGPGAAVDVAVHDPRFAGCCLGAVQKAFAAEDALGVGVLDGFFGDVGLVVVFAADEDEGGLEAAGVAGDGDAFELEVGVEVEEESVLEGAGFGFIGVDGEVALAGVARFAVGGGCDFGEEGPLEAGGEACAAAAAELGLFDFFDDGLRGHRQGFAEGGVTAGFDVLVIGDGVAILFLAVGEGGDACGEGGLAGFEGGGHGGGLYGVRRRVF